MELAYVLLAADVVLGFGLWAVYRARGAGRDDGELAALREERAALEEARRAAHLAAEEAIEARLELERTLKRAERLTRQWATGALAEERRAEPRDLDHAEARMANALKALRRI